METPSNPHPGLDIAGLRDLLISAYGPMTGARRRDPVSQLVRSLLGAGGDDALSEAVFARLRARFRPWSALAQAREDEVLPILATLSAAGRKSHDLIAVLNVILTQTGWVRLDFLQSWALDDALSWLQDLPGVDQEIAASVLNHSTLSRRVWPADPITGRVLKRLGLCSAPHDAGRSRDWVVEAAPQAWDGDDFTQLHRLVKRLGQTVCLAGSPDCRICPLSLPCPGVGLMQQVDRVSPSSGEKGYSESNRFLRNYIRRRIACSESDGVSADALKKTAVSLGLWEIDAAFSTEALPAGLHQIAGARPDDGSAALIFPLAVVTARARLGAGAQFLLIQETDARREAGDLFGPGMEALGLPASEALFVRVRDGPEALRVADEAVRGRATPTVVVELRRGQNLADLALTRRFNVAARRAGLFMFLITSDLSGTSAAATRWRIAAAPSRGVRRRIGPPAFHFDLVRNRHGRTGRWLVEWSARERSFLSARPVVTDHGEGHGPTLPLPVGAMALHRPSSA